MIIYHKTFEEAKEDFDDIDVKIDQLMIDHNIGSKIRSEGPSWREGLREMSRVLEKANVDPQIHVAMEYLIPYTGKSRIDFIISGFDENGKNSAVIVELKGWHTGNILSSDLENMVYEKSYRRDVLHPSYQAKSYVAYIKNFNSEAVDDKINLTPCSYLYYYHPSINGDVLLDNSYSDCIADSPIFFIDNINSLSEFISEHIKSPDGGETISKIENGKLTVSASLQESAILALKNKDYFLPIDDQAEVYARVLKGLKQACMKKEKKVFIVKGGPGTGKSVLALKLLAAMIAEPNIVTGSKPTYYVTKTDAPRSVFSKDFVLLSKDESSKMLFAGGSCFKDKNELPAIIVDEAHRLVNTTAKVKGQNPDDRSQIGEIISAAYGTVFFIDEKQHVSIEDLGTIAEIDKHAKLNNTVPEILEMKAQFRCGGSSDYLDWVESVLQYDDSKDMKKITDFSPFFEFKVFDDINEMEDALYKHRSEGFDARMVAGYCWPWDKTNPYSSKKEISIGNNYDRKWNKSTGCWILDGKDDDRIGCIHTVQGMEVDYIGVIIGDDMTFDENNIVFDATKRDPGDRSVFGCKKMHKEDNEGAHMIYDPIVRNTYRTLMTRGKKGCYIYATDVKLRCYLTKMNDQIKRSQQGMHFNK